MALQDPSQCLPMVQYAAELNDNIGKFTFPVTYQYDMKFRLKKQIKPSTLWNIIDNHLWAKCFSGSNRESFQNSNQTTSNFHSQRMCNDFNFRSCNRQRCCFQHKCAKCYRSGHTQRQCHSPTNSATSTGSHNMAATLMRIPTTSSNTNQPHSTR